MGIPAGAVGEPVIVRLERVSSDEVGADPQNQRRVSETFGVDVVRAEGEGPLQLAKPLWVQLRYTRDDYAAKRLAFWDNTKKTWRLFAASREVLGEDTVQGQLTFPYFQFAAFTLPNAIEGYASWYDYQRAANRTRYAHSAATNLYPRGTKLKITNLENGKSVEVEVVSTWSDAGKLEKRRVVDLAHHAFDHIGNHVQGTIPVRVEPITGSIASDGNDSDEPPPTNPQVLGVQTTVPAIRAQATLVVDGRSATLFAKGGDLTRPIASITKLITAMVILDTNPDFDTVVEYTAGDEAEGARLAVSPGETMTVRDLWYAALTGSANNATNALARSTGLTREEFLARMNAKVRTLGLAKTTFTDPTGLDPGNVSTAAEVARFAPKILVNRQIAQALTTRSYTFATRNTGVSHTIRNRDELIGRPLPIIAGKTGYLIEAGYCIVVLAKRPDGTAITVVSLGSPTSAARFADAELLLKTFAR